MFFYSHFLFSTNDYLWVETSCKENQSAQIDFSNFLSVLATKFLSHLVIQSIILQRLDPEIHGLNIYLSTTVLTEDYFPFYQSQLQLLLTWPSPHPHNHEKALTFASDAMSLPFLTQLDILTLDYIDSQTWVKTFGKLPSLKRVQGAELCTTVVS
jgi:hypothetical protein